MKSAMGIVADEYNKPVSNFNPLVIPWVRAYWSSGPRFLALNYVEGAPVSSWPDEVGSDDLASLSGVSPTFRATSVLNNQPGVEYSGLANLAKQNLDNVPQPYSQVAIAFVGDVNWGNAMLIFSASNQGILTSGHVGGVDTMRINGGAQLNGVLWDVAGGPGPYLLGGRYAGANSMVYQNGTGTLGDAGTVQRSALLGIGSNNSGSSNWGTNAPAPIAFVGIYAGDVFGHAEWPNLVDWASSFYGANIL